MALPISIPYTFANATTSIPLSQLDTDISTIYATVNGIGNGTVALANVVITGGIISNVSGLSTSSIANGTSNVSIATANGSVTVATAGNTAMTVDTSQNVTVAGTVAMGSSFKRNRIINGNMATDQRNAGAAQTITAGAALAYSVDRWYAYCTGANVTGQQVAGATANQYRYRFTGAASVTAIGFAQRIEAINSADLAGTTATLSIDLANSLLTTVTWTAYYANTTDTFGTLASPTVTSIATGTFTVTSTVTRYNAQISIPSAATTGLQIVLSVGAQTSGTWTIGSVQLEVGTKATPYEMQIYSDQLAQCQRYYFRYSSNSAYASFAIGPGTSTTNFRALIQFPTQLRSSPTVTIGGTFIWAFGNSVTAISAATYTFNTLAIDCTTTGTTAGFVYLLTDAGANNSYIAVASEL